MIWRGLIVIALLAVVGLTLFAKRQRPDELPLIAKPQPLLPGYYMIDATITETGPDGLPLYRMSAQRIQQNPADQSVRLDKLRLVYRADDTRDWTLTATSGFVPPDSKTIDLQGNVEIIGQPTPGAQPAIVRTDRMLVDAKTSIATAPGNVSIEMDRQRWTAVGLKADLKRQQLQLESQVHGELQHQ